MSVPSRAPSHRRLPARRRVLLGSLMVLAAAPIPLATSAGAAAPPGTPVLRHSAELVTPFGTENLQAEDVALSADGSTLAVASVVSSDQSGSTVVVVHERSGDRWPVQTTLRPPSTEGWAPAVAISADGDTLAVGSPRAPVLEGGANVIAAGEVHLFTRSGQTWRAAGRIVSPQPLFYGSFGEDVSLSGDGTRLIVATENKRALRTRAYVADTASRVVEALPAPAAYWSHGHSVAVSPDGTTVVVGARHGGAHPGLGGASVLVDDPVRGWVQRWHLEARPEEEFSQFGAAVAVTDAGTVVVGAPNFPDDVSTPHGVSVFDRRGSALVRTARFAPRYESMAGGLGSSVAVSADGSTVVAGAPFRSMAGGSIPTVGAGYRWVRSAGGWSWAGLLSVAHPGTDDYLGSSTAMSADGRVVALGAPDRGDAGAAEVFTAVPPGR